MTRHLLPLILLSGLGFNAYALPEVIDNSTYPPNAKRAGAAAKAAVTPSANSLIEMSAQLSVLKAEVQQLTGKLEEQANTIAELKKRQAKVTADFDERLQQVENKGHGEASPEPEPAAEPVPVPPPAEPEAHAKEPEPEAEKPKTAHAAPAHDPAAETKHGSKAEKTASPAHVAASGHEPAATNPPVAAGPMGKAKPPSAKAAEVVPANVPAAEKQEYDAAYTALRTGHTAESIAALNAYVQKYPDGGMANNAQYWLGEAHRVNKDAEAAKLAFNGVLQKYPNSAKVPDALLKLGYIAVEQKNPVQAKEYLNKVIQEFPDSSAARLAQKKLPLLDAMKPEGEGGGGHH